MLLVILQNAYRETGKYKDRDEWMERMWCSHTGRRLKEMLPDIEVYVENANPKLGRESNSIFPPDISHLKNVIKVTKPKVILACGKVAQEGLDELGVDYIPAPHPAWRQLSKKDTSRIRKKIASIV